MSRIPPVIQSGDRGGQGTRPSAGSSTIHPLLRAWVTSWVLLATSQRSYIRARCVSTVRVLTPSRLATWSLERPSATRRTTSTSRLEGMRSTRSLAGKTCPPRSMTVTADASVWTSTSLGRYPAAPWSRAWATRYGEANEERNSTGVSREAVSLSRATISRPSGFPWNITSQITRSGRYVTTTPTASSREDTTATTSRDCNRSTVAMPSPTSWSSSTITRRVTRATRRTRASPIDGWSR